MSDLYWCYPGDQPGGPYDITIARAADPPSAHQLLGERFPSPCVHRLTSPALVARYAELTAGQTSCLQVERLPSAYDEFRTGYRNGVDLEAMWDRGFDVS